MKDEAFACADEIYAWAEQSDDYWLESAKLAFTEEVVKLMDKRKITRRDLASRIGRTPAYITKILRGNNNFTLETMVTLSRALGMSLSLHLEPASVTAGMEKS